MLTPLQKSILAPLQFFDIYGFPLTLLEIHRYLYKGKWLRKEDYGRDISLYNIQLQIDALKSKTKIESSEGFYFLPGRAELVKLRAQRYLVSREKHKKAFLVCAVLTLLPGVEQIYITNTLAYGNARQESDIDLLIVTHPETLWTTRLFCAGLLKLMRKRPRADFLKKGHGQLSFEEFFEPIKRNKVCFCLSFFLSAAYKDIKTIMRKPCDPYLMYWIMQAVLIYDKPHDCQLLIDSNRWIKHCLPNARPYVSGQSGMIAPNIHLPAIGIFFERLAMIFQKKIMPEYIKEVSGCKDLGVVMNNQMLKFHVNDTREAVRMEFERRLNSLERL